MPPPARRLRCPSAQPDMEDARIFGVIAGPPEAPRVAYLKKSAEVSEEMLAALGGLPPTSVFRYGARCEEGRCAHFAGGRCSLGERIAAQLDPVVAEPPPCQIRPDCRWYAETGAAACLRCPQVTTIVPEADAPLSRAAKPERPSAASR